MPRPNDDNTLENASNFKQTKTQTEKSTKDATDPCSGDGAPEIEGQDQRTAADMNSKSKKSLAFHLSFVCLSLLVLIVSWDACVLSVATPIIAQQLDATTLQSFWASIAYMLGVAVTQPLFASISDVTGRKGPLYFSIFLFTVGSILFAVARDMMTIIAGRVIQGLGGGGLDVLQEMIVVDMTTLKERPLYLALMAIPTATGSVLGPIIGALFSETLFPLLFGILIFIGFGWYERWPAQPMIPYRLISNRTAIMVLIASTLHGAILYAILLYLPLFFQVVFLQTPLKSAISILPACCLGVGLSIISPIAVGITRRYRVQLWIGWFLMTLFLGLWCVVDQGTSQSEYDAFLALLGSGIGIIYTTNLIPIQASVKHVDDAGLAAGLSVVFRIFGGLIGLAAGSSAFNTVFRSQTASISPLPAELSGLSDPRQAVSLIPTLRSLDLPEATMNNLIYAYRISFRAIWIVLASFAGLGLMSSLLLKELNLEKEELGRQRFEAPKHQVQPDPAL
ncbi:hypothetical protein INS49_004046 [Diaporthe citri]|uniref:uncharacterized protein n=1 Tax=Diaporthe citri TaxID=83186 RepID=UPI001C80EFFC|nr:uncharacterized protein INS49_004046 [Diaporthe citri]KAG6354965.1 hypothetical protein INS49_004046 [Diaporthe citri]